MKSIIFFIASLLFFFSAIAADIERTVDGTQESNYTISCTMPVTRTDGAVLDVSEIQTVEFHRSVDGTVYTQVGSEVTCEFIEDIDALPTGLYYYKASVTDTGNRPSTLSNDRLVLTVERVAAPNPPTGLTGP